MRTIKFKTLGLLLLIPAIFVVVDASPVSAGPVFTVMNTSESLPDGVYWRSGTTMGSAIRETGFGVYKNDQVEAICYLRGEAVGKYGNDIWYKARNVTTPTVGKKENAGYINTHFVDDGMSAGNAAPGVPKCNTAPPKPKYKYRRGDAQRYATQHVYDRETLAGVDCAVFVSRALWAGGLPSSSKWKGDSLTDLASRRVKPGPTKTAGYAPSLLQYLVENNMATMTKIKWSDNTAGGAQIGDLIAYDWDKGGSGTYSSIDHVSIVTSLNPQKFPSVSEHTPGNKDRYWSWSLKKNKWIEHGYPGSTAYLIHITY